MTNYPKVSIIFPNYNGGKEPIECLNSIRQLNYPKDKLEVVVIDNNSSDGSDIKIEMEFPKVILIRNKTNLGFAKAVNQGIKKSSGDFVFIGNNDLVFEKNSIRNLIFFSLKENNIGIAGGILVSKQDRKKIISSFQTFNYITGRVKMNKIKIIKPCSVQWVQGCAMLIPRSIIRKVGIFDEGFEKAYFEDLDICKRVQMSGFKTMLYPSAIFYHHQSYTLDNVVEKKFKWYNWHKNKIRFVLKHASFFQITTILTFEALSSLFQTIFKSQPHFEPFIKALIENFKNYNEIKDKRKGLYSQ